MWQDLLFRLTIRTTPNAVARSIAGDHDCFVTKIDPSGALAYSTYLGGSDYDTVFAMAVDSSGNIYLGGTTGSIDFPVTQNGTPKNSAPGGTALLQRSTDQARSSIRPVLEAVVETKSMP